MTSFYSLRDKTQRKRKQKNDDKKKMNKNQQSDETPLAHAMMACESRQVGEKTHQVWHTMQLGASENVKKN